jgi:hypothetical protein
MAQPANPTSAQPRAPDPEGASQLPLQTADHAARLVDLCSRFTEDLFDWMDRAIANEPSAHRIPLKVAVSSVAMTLTDRLLYPTYLERPELIPPDVTRLL